uniref:Putative signal peptide protein n=1 Tax=uncultured bacterium pFosLip TaxID=380391 RepID=Q1PAF2_9BACT|nr:putative signal peptide protein [uncultured bacterium pFosLip]
MQIDMHFYGVYALARAAGIKDSIAGKIAYASQFVDDSIDDDHIVLSDNRSIVPTMTSHKPIDYQNALPGDQWKVWIPFHFLPGYKGKNFIDRLVCEKDSVPARNMLDYTLDSANASFWPHIIGIAAHVYADTFAHYGFIGISHDNNKVDEGTLSISPRHSSGIIRYMKAKYEEFKTRFISGFAEAIPVGHGAVGTYPDRPYLAWGYTYELRRDGSRKKKVSRDNLKDFLEGSKRLHEYFKRFAQLDPRHGDAGSGKDWGKIKPAVHDILKTEGTKEKRIDKWLEHLEKGTFCKTTHADKKIKYDEGLWRPRRAELEHGKTAAIEKTDACRFIRAARRYRNFVLSELLPDIGLTLP